jgi:hypothetical protein
LGNADSDDTIVIAYDDGTLLYWWCSDRDSFGAAVKFTPAEYPCQVVGARAVVGYDTTEGASQVYLRVFDDNGTGGLPGTVLYEQHRTDIPKVKDTTFRDYNLTTPVTIDSGDFYICFWQKHYFNMLFGTDTHFDYPPREWWFFPDLGWVTPMVMDAADQLIRARVVYSSGVAEELTASELVSARLSISPNPSGPGMATLRYSLPGKVTAGVRVAVYDAAGRLGSSRALSGRAGCVPLDLRVLQPGVYMVTVSSGSTTATQKLVVQR